MKTHTPWAQVQGPFFFTEMAKLRGIAFT